MIMKHLKIKIMSIAFMAVATSSMAQSLNKMNWLNEPQQWEIKLCVVINVLTDVNG